MGYKESIEIEESDMLYIYEVKNMFDCDMETARKVVQNMQIDFSECTKEQFNREARFIYSRLKNETM
jgi:hypothetical protein